MASPEPDTSLLLTRQTMASARIVPVAGGEAAAYSCGRPGAEGENEDALLVVPLAADRAVLAVTDGAGGHAAGAMAAATTLECLKASLEATADDPSVRAAVLDGIETANARVLESGTGAATTLAAVEIDGAAVRPYHVGDSEILATGQRGALRLQIVAHSPTGYAVESGLLTEDDAIDHAQRHVVSNLVGTSDMRIDVGSPATLRPRDTVLVASDGLFDNLQQDEIIDIIRRGKLLLAARRLAETARARMQEGEADGPSKPDDLTFILFRRPPPKRTRRASP